MQLRLLASRMYPTSHWAHSARLLVELHVQPLAQFGHTGTATDTPQHDSSTPITYTNKLEMFSLEVAPTRLLRWPRLAESVM